MQKFFCIKMICLLVKPSATLRRMKTRTGMAKKFTLDMRFAGQR